MPDNNNTTTIYGEVEIIDATEDLDYWNLKTELKSERTIYNRRLYHENL